MRSRRVLLCLVTLCSLSAVLSEHSLVLHSIRLDGPDSFIKAFACRDINVVHVAGESINFDCVTSEDGKFSVIVNKFAPITLKTPKNPFRIELFTKGEDSVVVEITPKHEEGALEQTVTLGGDSVNITYGPTTPTVSTSSASTLTTPSLSDPTAATKKLISNEHGKEEEEEKEEEQVTSDGLLEQEHLVGHEEVVDDQKEHEREGEGQHGPVARRFHEEFKYEGANHEELHEEHQPSGEQHHGDIEHQAKDEEEEEESKDGTFHRSDEAKDLLAREAERLRELEKLREEEREREEERIREEDRLREEERVKEEERIREEEHRLRQLAVMTSQERREEEERLEKKHHSRERTAEEEREQKEREQREERERVEREREHERELEQERRKEGERVHENERGHEGETERELHVEDEAPINVHQTDSAAVPVSDIEHQREAAEHEGLWRFPHHVMRLRRRQHEEDEGERDEGEEIIIDEDAALAASADKEQPELTVSFAIIEREENGGGSPAAVAFAIIEGLILAGILGGCLWIFCLRRRNSKQMGSMYNAYYDNTAAANSGVDSNPRFSDTYGYSLNNTGTTNNIAWETMQNTHSINGRAEPTNTPNLVPVSLS